MSKTYHFGVLLLGVAWGPLVLGQTQDAGSSGVTQQCLAIDGDTSAAWRTIDWQTDLIIAQQQAVEQQKPLFIWAMDGHPLGCT